MVDAKQTTNYFAEQNTSETETEYKTAKPNISCFNTTHL